MFLFTSGKYYALKVHSRNNKEIKKENDNLEKMVTKTRLPQTLYRNWFYEKELAFTVTHWMQYSTYNLWLSSKKAYLKGPSTPRGYNIRAKILVPPNAHLFKLPVLVHVYAGPGYNYVTNDFNVGWDQFLVTNRSVAVVFIDGRGSGSSGNQQKFAVNRKLGKYEIIDQLQVDNAEI